MPAYSSRELVAAQLLIAMMCCSSLLIGQCIGGADQACVSAQERDSLREAGTTSPLVTYRDGKLSIHAEGVTLQDTLRSVVDKTGARLDVQGVSLQEPVFVDLAPGPAREVVRELLEGSRFNYILTSPAGDASGLELVAISSRDQSAPSRATEVAQSTLPRSPSPSLYGAGFAADLNDEETPEIHLDARGRTAPALSGEELDQLQKLQLKQIDEAVRQQESSTPPIPQ